MFEKKEVNLNQGEATRKEGEKQDHVDALSTMKKSNRPTNTVLKGSRITGDIKVNCDVDVSGEVLGNITSDGDAHIHIQGLCKGTVQTAEGDIIVSGDLQDGNIISGGNVTVTGSFKGGEMRAKEKLYIDGTFEGRLQANDIEVGPRTQGKGELVYGEFISIARGARIDANVVHEGKKAKGDKP